MAIEIADLERRMLAQEQVLQVLIAHMTEAEPKFLDRLRAVFAGDQPPGRAEQDLTGTEQYAMQFIRRIEVLRETGESGEDADPKVGGIGTT